jgi:hypothetical protein
MRKKQKFGITIPQSVEEALRIDKEMNTTYWADAIAKEMKNNRIAFEFINENESVPHGYKYIRCHMNFEVKMDFTRKGPFRSRRTHDGPTTFPYILDSSLP